LGSGETINIKKLTPVLIFTACTSPPKLKMHHFMTICCNIHLGDRNVITRQEKNIDKTENWNQLSLFAAFIADL
jgi:hypothetical protein